jgi:signal transduction histidine kinase
MRSDDELTEAILRHVADIGAGRCSITDATIEKEPDSDVREILAALLMLHEDLIYSQEFRDRAEAEREASARDQERLTDELREAVRVRDEFLSIASHELRTPITTLNLQVGILGHYLGAERDPKATGAVAENATVALAEKATSALDAMHRQVQRLERLVAELLNVSRIMAGRLRLSPETVDLTALVQETLARFQHEAHNVGSTLALDSDGPVHGQWDPFWLDQLVTNLISNAIRYGRGRPIDISLSTASTRARLCVRDQGLGIAACDLSRIFERFERSAPNSQYSGLGLGLWIARNIVDAMSGTISVESELGLGSTFTVLLPTGAPGGQEDHPGR